MNYPSRKQPDTNSTPKKGFSTQARQRLFLKAFAEHANVGLAARSAHINRTTVYTWLEHDEAFSFAFNQAKEDARDVLRAEIFKRGHDGWDEPVWGANGLKGTVRKYSDTLLIFHAKAMMPEYREKSQVDVNTYGGDMAAFRDLVLSALAEHPEAKVAVAEALMEKARGSHAN